MSKVTLSNVTKRFDDVTAIDDLSLNIGDGEFVVLLGPTGAGKTTTLRLVAGLEKADRGTIHIAGDDVTKAPIANRDVAFVFQQYSLYPHYTVYENLAFPMRSPMRQVSEQELHKRVTEVAELLRISHKLQNRATNLSGGEMQRVAIGRALVRQPSIYLMDEPLSSLDAKLRADLRVELKRIQLDRGATVLYVTHDQVEAMTLADRIGVLARGRLIQIGTPSEIYSRPINTYVANRLGSPAINLLPPGSLGIENPNGAELMGVRPEDVVVGKPGPEARVLQVEHKGAETVIVLEVQDQRIHALTQGHNGVAPGQSVTISARNDSPLYFDDLGQLLEKSHEYQSA